MGRYHFFPEGWGDFRNFRIAGIGWMVSLLKQYDFEMVRFLAVKVNGVR